MFNDEKLVAMVVSMMLVILWVAVHYGHLIDNLL
jgi:hypothetical protein